MKSPSIAEAQSVTVIGSTVQCSALLPLPVVKGRYSVRGSRHCTVPPQRGLADTTGGWLAGGEEPLHADRPAPQMHRRSSQRNEARSGDGTWHTCFGSSLSPDAQPPAWSSRAPTTRHHQHEGPSGPASTMSIIVAVAISFDQRRPTTTRPPSAHRCHLLHSSIIVGVNSRHGCSLFLLWNDYKTTTCTRPSGKKFASLQLITSFKIRKL